MKNKVIEFIKAAAAVLTLCVPLTAGAANLTDADEINKLPTSLQNGSFEMPNIWKGWNEAFSFHTREPIVHSVIDNEEKAISQGTHYYWNTTSSDNNVGVWLTSYTDMYKAAKSGEYFVEINTNESATLYQNIRTAPGSKLKWGVSHAAHAPKVYDTMALIIGPAQQPESIVKKSADDKDVFMKMLDWLKTNRDSITPDNADIRKPVAHGDDFNHGDNSATQYTIYSKDFTSGTALEGGNTFSATSGEGYPNEWKITFITDNDGKWYNYGLNYDASNNQIPGSDKDIDPSVYDYTYTVPEGQNAAIFAFVAVIGHDYFGSDNGLYGNFIDDVRFEASYPLNVSTTGGGSGEYVIDTVSKTVTKDTPQHELVSAGTTVTITAKPEAGYNFVGYIADNSFISYSKNPDKFTGDNSSGYTFSIPMTFEKNIQLVFSRPFSVTFDANGGTFPDTGNNIIETDLADDGATWAYRYDNAKYNPTKDNAKFLGWYCPQFGEGELIEPEVAAHLNANGTTEEKNRIIEIYYTPEGQTANAEITQDGAPTALKYYDVDNIVPYVDGNYGATFIAQWSYNQQVKALTLDTGTDYTDPTGGAAVFMSHKRGERDMLSGTTDQLNDCLPGDVVTVKETTNDGYRFMGWFDEQGKKLSMAESYEYVIGGAGVITARFIKEYKPHLAYVAEDDTADRDKLSETPFEGGSHYIDDKSANTKIDSIGQTLGNTISTAFVGNTILDDIPYNDVVCTWTVTMPSDGTYLKVPEIDSENRAHYPFLLSEIIKDAETVTVNKGVICEAMDGATQNITFADKLSTTMSGGGSANITYAIVLDNIYSPNAKAIVEFDKAAGDAMFDASVGDVLNSIVHSTTAEGFHTNPNNKYHPAGSQNTSEVD